MPIHIIDTGTQSISGDVIIQGLSSTQFLQQWKSNTGNTLMTVESSGNIGIGTISPSEKLAVVGNLSASGIAYAGGSKLAAETFAIAMAIAVG